MDCSKLKNYNITITGLLNNFKVVTTMNIGKKIKELRTARNLSQEKFAEYFDITPQPLLQQQYRPLHNRRPRKGWD